MSHPTTLLKQDHLIIKGHSYKVKNPWEILGCVELDFTIQVNGKMANFTNSFIVSTMSTDGGVSWIGIENGGEWLLVVRILKSLWYEIVSEWEPYMPILERWVEQIKESDKQIKEEQE